MVLLTSTERNIAQLDGSDSEVLINEVSGFLLKRNLRFVAVEERCIRN